MPQLTGLEEDLKILIEKYSWGEVLQALVVLWDYVRPRHTPPSPMLRTILELAAEKAECW